MATATASAGRVMLRCHEGGRSSTEALTPEQARKVAVHLLSAAGRAERNA